MQELRLGLRVFSKYMSSTKVAGLNSSYFYLVDEKGLMIYHPDKSKIAKPVENEKIKEVMARFPAVKTKKWISTI